VKYLGAVLSSDGHLDSELGRWMRVASLDERRKPNLGLSSLGEKANSSDLCSMHCPQIDVLLFHSLLGIRLRPGDWSASTTDA